jgi:hypothetical protein
MDHAFVQDNGDDPTSFRIQFAHRLHGPLTLQPIPPNRSSSDEDKKAWMIRESRHWKALLSQASVLPTQYAIKPSLMNAKLAFVVREYMQNPRKAKMNLDYIIDNRDPQSLYRLALILSYFDLSRGDDTSLELFRYMDIIKDDVVKQGGEDSWSAIHALILMHYMNR